MNRFRHDSDGKNPHWLCLLITDLPVVLGIVLTLAWGRNQLPKNPTAMSVSHPQAITQIGKPEESIVVVREP